MENFLSREAVLVFWESFVGDIDDLAADYRDDGWTVHVLTPGDVTVVPDEPAIDVLLPTSEVDVVEGVVADGMAFGHVEVYTEVREQVVFALVVLRDRPSSTALFVPTYYALGEVADLRESLGPEGALSVVLRDLPDERAVAFDLDDPDPLLPDGA